jgi:hypothetical protein
MHYTMVLNKHIWYCCYVPILSNDVPEKEASLKYSPRFYWLIDYRSSLLWCRTFYIILHWRWFDITRKALLLWGLLLCRLVLKIKFRVRLLICEVRYVSWLEILLVLMITKWLGVFTTSWGHKLRRYADPIFNWGWHFGFFLKYFFRLVSSLKIPYFLSRIIYQLISALNLKNNYRLVFAIKFIAF